MKVLHKIMVGSLICMAGFVHAAVLTDFVSGEGGNVGSSVDVTWSNLTGPVTVGSLITATAVPLIDSVKNTMTETDGVSGDIKVNILAVDDLSSAFVPSTWSGGGQSAGNAINVDSPYGWGVRRDGRVNGHIQTGEALILTFDLSALSLGADQAVALAGITFYDKDGTSNGDVWMRDFDVAAGSSGAGIQLANNVVSYPGAVPIRDGDQIALMAGATDTRLVSLELDILVEGFELPAQAVLFIEPASGSVTLSATNLTSEVYNTLQWTESVANTNWASVSTTTGVTVAEWMVPASGATSFFRVESSPTFPPPKVGYLYDPIDDAYVEQQNPSMNFGGATSLGVRGSATSQEMVSYLKFVVDDVPGSIDEVLLKVYSTETIAGLGVYEVSDTVWNEDQITWGSRPSVGALIVNKPSVSDGWNTFDLSSLISTPGTYSIALVTTDDRTSLNMSSKESMYNPVLELCSASDDVGKYSAIFGGGPLYGGLEGNAATIKASGLSTVMLWAAKVNGSGEVFYNSGSNLLTSNGEYAGDSAWPEQLLNLKKAPSSVKRIEFSLSAWGDASFANIETLIAAEGTGEDSSLYKSFKVLRDVLGADAINFDDESNYDVASTVEFGKMLSVLGYKVTLCPYRDTTYWGAVYTQLEAYQPGLVDRVYLQCYAGGSYNTPLAWNSIFPGLNVAPGLSVSEKTPAEMKSTLDSWKDDSAGGFIWILDEILSGNVNSVKDYADAVIDGVN